VLPLLRARLLLMKDLLLVLPSDLFRLLVTEWLHFIALVHLDTAYAGNLNFVDRGVVTCPPVKGNVAFGLISAEKSASAVEWLDNKGLYASEIWLTITQGFVDNALVSTFFEQRGHATTSVTCSISKGASSFLDWIVASCTNIREMAIVHADDPLSIEPFMVQTAGSLACLYFRDVELVSVETSFGTVLPKLLSLGSECPLASTVDSVATILAMCPNIVCAATPATNDYNCWWLSCCPRLTVLSLNDSRILADKPLSMALEGKQYLTTLHIDGAEGLNGDFAVALMENCPRIRHLSLGGCIAEDAWLQLIRHYGAQLQHLSVRWWYTALLTNTIALAIAEHCPNLLGLEMEADRAVTCKALCRLLSACTQLQELAISSRVHGTSILRAIARNCRMLRFLNLHCYSECTPEALQNIVRACPLLDTVVCSLSPTNIQSANWLKCHSHVKVVTLNRASPFWYDCYGRPPWSFSDDERDEMDEEAQVVADDEAAAV
jgi:hypothetical protein